MTLHTTSLPRTVDELTTQWLSDALSVQNPGTVVAEVAVEDVIWGTSTKVRLALTYAPGSGDTLPTALCVKGAFHDASMAAVDATGTRHEALFFAELAPRLSFPLPRVWFAGADDLTGVIILDDLAAAGATFGDPLVPWEPASVEAGLAVLAGLHGETWDRTFDDIPWLVVGNEPVRQAVGALFSEQHWTQHFAQPSSPTLPEDLRDRQRILAAYARLWELDDSGVLCVTHGDAHIGNTYLDAAQRPLFLDWASPGRTPWSNDVAYFVCGALSIADRREHEEYLLRSYLAALSAAGGPAVPFDAAWLEYRQHLLHGLIWATVPPTMQSVENVAAMAERYAAAATDHQVLALLER